MIVNVLHNVLESRGFPCLRQPSWTRCLATGAPNARTSVAHPFVPRRSFEKNLGGVRRRAPAETFTPKKWASEAEPSKRLLRPPVLSARLKKLCDEGEVDAAVSMLKNAPLDAQNTPVWNTLIWECMKSKRFKLAYQLFVDVSIHPFFSR